MTRPRRAVSDYNKNLFRSCKLVFMKPGSLITRRSLLAGASAALLATSRSSVRFVDITKSAGITFRHSCERLGFGRVVF